MPTRIPIPLFLFCTVLLTSEVLAQRAERPRLDEGEGSAHSLAFPRHEDPLRLLLERGVTVEDHPNGFGLHAHLSAAVAAECGMDTGPACAIIRWQPGAFPVTGAEYHASVPGVVTLRGPDTSPVWTPSVHCVTWDSRRRIIYEVAAGPTCMNIVDAQTQEMQWFVGGQIEGTQDLSAGTYEGWIPVRISSGSRYWVVDVPVTYQRYREVAACELNAGGNININNIPIAIGGTITMEPQGSSNTTVKITGTLGEDEYCGSDGSECGSGITANTGWARIRWTGNSGYEFSISKATIDAGAGETDEDWTYQVGYFDADDNVHGIQIAETPSFTESANVWTDSDGWGHIFIGGNIEIPSTWAAWHHTYQGTGTVTFTCTP